MSITTYIKAYKRFILLFAIPFIFSVMVAGQNRIVINAPETVYEGQQFKVNYVIESDTEIREAVIIKNMEGFDILYGPAISTSLTTRFEEGKRTTSYYSTSTYVLEAKKEGKYTLPKAEVKINGNKYKSENFKIEVKKLDAAEVLESLADIDAFIKVIPSKKRVGTTDTLTLTYRLYTTKEIERIVRTDFPLIRGFYATNITNPRQLFTEEVINGKTYKTANLRELILQPQADGVITIPEGSITVLYTMPTGRKLRDMWGDTYEEKLTEEKVLTIESVTISVLDLQAI